MNEDWRNVANVCVGPSHEIIQRLLPELLAGSFGLNARRSGRVFLFSDWGGEHQDSAYTTFSCLLCDAESLSEWLFRVDSRRSAGRTFSYKTLNSDVLRRLDLAPILSAADSIRGVLLSVCFHRTLGSAFKPPSDPKLWDGYNRDASLYKPHVFEKMMRTVDMSGYLSAICVSETSELFYILDDDSIAENKDQQEVFTRGFRSVVALATSRPPTLLRISNVSNCGVQADAEMACSLADLAAGALTNAVNYLLPSGPESAPLVAQMFPRFDRPKVDVILRWLRSDSGALAKYSFVVGPREAGLSVGRFVAFDTSDRVILLPASVERERLRRNR
jgi:hypothetical protein